MPVVPSYRMVLKATDTGAEVKVRLQTAAIIGRTDPFSSYKPDINLDGLDGHDAGVSRRHAIIIPDEEAFLIKDLDSANGTFINGMQLKPNILYPVCSGDTLRLGYLELQFTYKQLVLSGELTLSKKSATRRMTAALNDTPTIIDLPRATVTVSSVGVTGQDNTPTVPAAKTPIIHWAKKSAEHLTVDQQKAVELLRKIVINRDISERMLIVIASKAVEQLYWKTNHRLAVLQAACEYGYVSRDNAELMREQRRLNDIRFDMAE